MNKKINAKASACIGIICFVLLVILDQIVKKWAVIRLKDHDPIIWIENVFQLRYLENHGAAFGILQGKISVFLIITIVILLIIIYCYARIPFVAKFRFLRIFMVLIAAGAIGNAIDRVVNHYVVDFFYFNLINFPIFNVADIYVTCATILLVVFIIFRLKDEDFAELTASLRLKKKN